jgi:glycosyltransferase involved in cell wall biosynthesis
MNSEPSETYDLPFGADNVYEHALTLLLRHPAKAKNGEIHLDIGCSLGRIAEKVQSELNRTYVGVGGSGGSLGNPYARGFETHTVRLEGRDFTLQRLKQAVGARMVGSITFLDTIGRVLDGDEILRAIAELAREHLAPVVMSAPNVAHRDIGAKLAFGRWDYPATGQLDHTHLVVFDQKRLTAALEKAGLHTVDRYDVIEVDQHFPADHPALTRGTSLNQLLFATAELSNPNATVTQFVCLCQPGKELVRETCATQKHAQQPLISVIVRTQGGRPHTLAEVLTCLCGQVDTDFEVVVVGHRLDEAGVKSVEQTIDDTPTWLRDKIRLVRLEDGGRSRPLNVGFANARGRYIGVVDDDDIPMGNWVETFRELDSRNPGRVLRAVTVQQDVVNVHVNGRLGLRASGPLSRVYPSEFDIFDHMVDNRSPNTTIAFPRGAFHDLGIRFDESVDTAEDWDFLMRVVAVCGVASSPAISGVYRWWLENVGSRSLHPPEQWRRNYEHICRKLDETPFILARGQISNLRRLMNSLGPGGGLSPISAKRGPPPGQLQTADDGIFWGDALAKDLIPDLARPLRAGVRARILLIRMKYWMHIVSRRRRRKYRSRIQAYRQLMARLPDRRRCESFPRFFGHTFAKPWRQKRGADS